MQKRILFWKFVLELHTPTPHEFPKKDFYMPKYKRGSWAYVKNSKVREWARRKEQERLSGVETNVGNEGHVYICSVGFGDLYKIGKAKNLQRRMKELQASNPLFKCVWSAHVKDMHAEEKKLHGMFKKQKVNREIFALKKGDILTANNSVQSG